MAFSAQGMLFRFSTTTGITTAAGGSIGEVVSYSFGVPSRTMIDVSHLGSTMETKTPGILKGSQVSIECNFVSSDTGQAALRNGAASTVVQSLLIGFTDSNLTKLIVDGYVSGYDVSGALNDKNKLAITFDVIQVTTWGTYS
jgi:hypothetical protein